MGCGQWTRAMRNALANLFHSGATVKTNNFAAQIVMTLQANAVPHLARMAC